MLSFEVDGVPIHLHDVDDRVVLHMSRDGSYEPDSVRAWAKMVRPGLVAIDVGAYTGLFSVVAAQRGAQVVAFEPMPANRWRLSCNLGLNKVQARVLPCALSDRDGPMSLHHNPRVPLTTGASLESGNALHRATTEVMCTTLDALAFANVCAIKIDVERHEAAVLRGAMATICRERPHLLIETLDTTARDEVLDMLPDYQIEAVLDGRNTVYVPK